MVSAAGGLLGILLGFGAAKIISAVSPLPAYASPLTFLLGVVFTSAIGIFFGLYPAVKAAELNAIDGLRYE